MPTPQLTVKTSTRRRSFEKNLHYCSFKKDSCFLTVSTYSSVCRTKRGRKTKERKKLVKSKTKTIPEEKKTISVWISGKWTFLDTTSVENSKFSGMKPDQWCVPKILFPLFAQWKEKIMDSKVILIRTYITHLKGVSGLDLICLDSISCVKLLKESLTNRPSE